ncbi:MAG: toll/interleukin-1 receptor domain-containing protein [Actinomycetota bacterium]
MPLVFVSYSHEDEEFARLLSTSLERQGFNVWRDKGRIRSGDWERKIEAAIRRAEHFVLVVSPRSWASSSVQDEFALARQVLNEDQIHPVVLEQVSWLGLSRFHAHDAQDGQVPASLFWSIVVEEEPLVESHTARDGRTAVIEEAREGERQFERLFRATLNEPDQRSVHRLAVEVNRRGKYRWGEVLRLDRDTDRGVRIRANGEIETASVQHGHPITGYAGQLSSSDLRRATAALRARVGPYTFR